MRMLEIFSSERTYLLVIPDANYVASLLEQILHYMVQKGMLTVTGLLCVTFIIGLYDHGYRIIHITNISIVSL